MTISVKREADLPGAAARVLEVVRGHSVLALRGEMGAGKTTLARALCQSCLGVRDMVCSPTFSLVNEYSDSRGDPIYHFDFYRVKSLDEALDMGCLDYFASGHLCLVEWPELVEPLLPPDTVSLLIEPLPDGSRRLTISLP